MGKINRLFFLLIFPLVLHAADVYWEPANPKAGDDVTIYYNRDARGIFADDVYLHIGYDDWTSTEDDLMSNVSGDYYYYTYSIPGTAETVNFVFTNLDQDTWDNNSGLNWHLNLALTLDPENPEPQESFTLTFDNVSQSGSMYWYVETFDVKQLPVEDYQPTGTVTSDDHWAVETPLVSTGEASQYSIDFPAFNSGQQIVDKIKYTFHYSDDTWDGKIYEISFSHDGSFASFTSPDDDAEISSGGSVTISGSCDDMAEIKIWGGQELLTTTSGTSFNYSWTPSDDYLTAFGDYWVTIQGTDSEGNISFARREVYIGANPTTSYNGSLEDGVTVSGSSATIALYAPGIDYVAIKGDWNGSYAHGTMMNNNGDDWWWIEVSGLDDGEHSFQYEAYDEGFAWTKNLADPYSKELIWTSPGSDSESSDFSYARTVFEINAIDFTWTDDSFSPPDKEKFIIYETHIGDFSGEDNFEGDYSDMLVKVQEGYFTDLGINAVEFLPLHAFGGSMSWGYNPNFYMAPPGCYGTIEELKTLINAFHNEGIAVILDVVFNHTYGSASTFQLWHDVGYYDADEWQSYHDFTNDPYYEYSDSDWGYPLDHAKDKTRELIDETLAWWVNEYHVDGFRFDHTDNMNWYGYDYGLQHYSWAVKQIDSDLFLIAEEDEPDGVNGSDFDAYWEFSTFHIFEDNIYEYGDWGTMSDVAEAIYHDGNDNHYGPVKYIENHDESRVIYECTTYQGMTDAEAVKKSKLAAAILFTCTGTPMIYHGQEFGQNAEKDGTEPQPLQWDNLNTESGAELYEYYQKLIDLRKNSDALSDWVLETNSYSDDNKTIVYWRDNGTEEWVIAANFDDSDHTLDIEFPTAGNWSDVMNDGSITINSTTYADYDLAASEAVIFKYVSGNIYVPGGHSDWDLDDDNKANLKENFGGTSDYYGKTIQASQWDAFELVYGDWDYKWCAGYWISSYDQVWNIGWTGSGSGYSACWSAEPNNYIHINMKNPADSLETSLPTGIMTLSAYPAEVDLVEVDYYYNGSLTLHIQTDKEICSEEKIYARLAPDGDYTSDVFVEATGSGTDYYAVVTGLSFDSYIDYYVLTTTLAYEEGNDLDNFPDLMTINYNTNYGANYQVAADASLSVELSQFSGEYKNGKVQITWRTESEVNNRGFNLYRKSESDDKFLKINSGLIEGAGNSSQPVEYSYTDAEVVPGASYTYKLEDIETTGNSEFSDEITVDIPETAMEVPDKFDLTSLYPNPFNPVLTIEFDIPQQDIVNIAVYDLCGQKVEQLLNNSRNAGSYSISWNASQYSSGIYFVKMISNNNVITKRCVLIK